MHFRESYQFRSFYENIFYTEEENVLEINTNFFQLQNLFGLDSIPIMQREFNSYESGMVGEYQVIPYFANLSPSIPGNEFILGDNFSPLSIFQFVNLSSVNFSELPNFAPFENLIRDNDFEILEAFDDALLAPVVNIPSIGITPLPNTPPNLTTLNGPNGFTVDGLFANSNSVYPSSGLAPAGDFNGDGYDDFIFAALEPGAAFRQYVIYGQQSGFPAHFDLTTLDGSNGFEIIRSANRVVAPGGDINGDGYDDIILGNLNGRPAGGDRNGSTQVIFGAPNVGANFDLTTLDGTNGFTFLGNRRDLSARSISSGDVNGDGLSDVIIGAYLGNGLNIDSGSVYVVFGQTTPFAFRT